MTLTSSDGVAIRSWPGTGGDTPVLLLHGLSGTSWDWNRSVMRLATLSGPLAAVDLPGFGASAWRAREQYTVPEWSAAVRSVARELWGERRFTCMGHSLGGKIAIHLAASEPRLERLVLVDSGPTLGRGNFREHRFDSIPSAIAEYRSLYAGEPDDVFLLRMADYLEADVDGNGVRIRRDPKVAESLSTLDIEAERALLWSCWSEITVPITLLRAERSHVLEDDVTAKMVANNDTAEVRIVPNASHNVLSDAPEVIAAALAEAWSSSDGG